VRSVFDVHTFALRVITSCDCAIPLKWPTPTVEMTKLSFSAVCLQLVFRVPAYVRAGAGNTRLIDRDGAPAIFGVRGQSVAALVLAQ
jgi:hypothetical protein